ncbi:MAG: C40 family peptidase, partial [Bacteroidia bacterium]|nr:C40 family peptidase [Bacteroidia bacterium]
MNYGICSLSVIPVRAEAAHRSEQVSQLLFGETFSILEEQGEWLRVRITFDDYEGWIQKSQHAALSLTEYNELQRSRPFLSFDLVQILINHQSITSVLLGSVLPWYRSGHCRIGNINYNFEGNARQAENSGSGKFVVENAYMYLNAPYLWGGRSPFGIDCSGLTQMAYKLSGVSLKRDAWMQAEQGQTIHLLDETQTGDLAFFDNEEGRIIHVGILTSKNRIIHASGQVRLDSIDHHGIFNTDLKKYT